MVQRQLHKWPHGNFNPSKTRVADLRDALLDGGFTKEVHVEEAVGDAPAELGSGGGANDIDDTGEHTCMAPELTRLTIMIPSSCFTTSRGCTQEARAVSGGRTAFSHSDMKDHLNGHIKD